MPLTKEDLLRPLFDFEARHGFKLSELTGHHAHKWVVDLNGFISYEGTVKIQEKLGQASFSPNSENTQPIISLMVEGESKNYFNSEQTLDHSNDHSTRVAVVGLWEKNSSDPEDQGKYYYFEPTSN